MHKIPGSTRRVGGFGSRCTPAFGMLGRGDRSEPRPMRPPRVRPRTLMIAVAVAGLALAGVAMWEWRGYRLLRAKEADAGARAALAEADAAGRLSDDCRLRAGFARAHGETALAARYDREADDWGRESSR